MNIDELILEVPGVFYLSFEKPHEVTKGEYSPIFINIKHTLSNPEIREELSGRLVGLIGDVFDHICGIESGGSYYASSVADLLNKPLSFMRKENKLYGDRDSIVGAKPAPGAKVAILDDVFATGTTALRATKYFRRIKCKPSVFVIFSYGHENEIGKKLGAPVSSLTNFENVCAMAHERKLINSAEFDRLREHVLTYKDVVKP